MPNVTNAIATLVDGDTQYGATVQYNCSIGYIPIGNSTITCPLNGSWPTHLTCTILECGHLGGPVNGYTIGNNFTYGSTVTFSCDIGYELEGNETALCQANGQWSSNIPLCSIIDCPDPGTPNNGHQNSSNFSYGASISFTCNVGYELSGNSVIICEGGKKWNGSIPTCNITYCNDPGVPENGFALPSNFSYGTIVLFQCNIGYELSGGAIITCQADNNWDNNLPMCTLYSSTSAPSGQPNDKETNNKGIIIGVTVGVSLIFVILIIMIIIMVTLFVWRLHHRTGKMIVNPRDNGQEMSAVTNPMSKCFVNISLKLKTF